MGSVKRKPTIFFIYYFVIFLGHAIQGSFLNLYLSNAGMGSGTIGAINGTVQILGLAIFPVWGHFADRASNKNKVLIFGLILSIGALSTPIFFIQRLPGPMWKGIPPAP